MKYLIAPSDMRRDQSSDIYHLKVPKIMIDGISNMIWIPFPKDKLITEFSKIEHLYREQNQIIDIYGNVFANENTEIDESNNCKKDPATKTTNSYAQGGPSRSKNDPDPVQEKIKKLSKCTDTSDTNKEITNKAKDIIFLHDLYLGIVNRINALADEATKVEEYTTFWVFNKIKE